MSQKMDYQEGDVIQLSSGSNQSELVLGMDSAFGSTTDVNVTTVVQAYEPIEDTTRKDIIIAGPTNPLSSKRVSVLKPARYIEEPLNLECEWKDCSFRTRLMHEFMSHVVSHEPAVEVIFEPDASAMRVVHNCKWALCSWSTQKNSQDLERHLYLHAYHTKLKCIGLNTLGRSDVNPCRAEQKFRNVLPDLSEDLLCAWGTCCEQFTNIQLYYNHISGHIDRAPRGKIVPGGIKCEWRGCTSVVINAPKLRDHLRSHSQEKLLACPTCGGLFASRTRFFDHCRRQVLFEEQNFACDTCLKCFSTERLLRDHIRGHVNTYKCPECEMSCASPSSLKAHMQYRHSDEKPYACEQCDHAAKSYGDLVRHVKSHTEPVFKCEEEGCGFQCKAVTSLRGHWKKTHNAESSKYACHLCEKRFFKGYYLTRHLISIHKLQWPSGHSRFRYKQNEDGLYRLLTVRFESVEEQV